MKNKSQNLFIALAFLAGIHQAAAQNIYVSDASGDIVEFTTNGTRSIFATGLDPEGLAFDKTGDMFEADQASGNIYEFTNNAGTLSSNPVTFATGLSEPTALAFDSAGNLFVAEFNSGSIYEFINNSGTLSTNPVNLVFEELSLPLSMACDGAGNLFVGQNNGNIYEFTNNAGRLSSNFGIFAYLHINLGGQRGYQNSPVTGLAFDSLGNLFATDSTDNQNGDGFVIEFTNGVATEEGNFATGLSEPNGLAFDSTGSLFVANPGPSASINTILEFTNGVAGEEGVFASSGLNNPQYIAIAPIVAPNPTLSVSIKMFAGIILNNGNIGSNYLIQSTANLSTTNWITLTNVTLPTNPYIYIDYSSSTNSKQFYRAVSQ